MKKHIFNLLILSSVICLSPIAGAQNVPSPLKPTPQIPLNSPQKAPIQAPIQAPMQTPSTPQNDRELLTNSYAETSNVIVFVENNLQIAEVCDQRLAKESHTKAFANWFETQKANFDATLKFKFAYEQKLASLYGPSIQETFKKRDRLTLKQVANDMQRFSNREEKEFVSSCKNWLTSIEDPSSFFHSKLSIGLQFFGLKSSSLLTKIENPRNW